MLDDVRLGWRKLRQQPGFTIVAVLTLALGIGATSAVFSLVQGVLLTPPPYRDPDRLALIQPAPTEGRQLNARRWSAAQWTEWQRDSKAFESFAGYLWSFNFMVLDEGSESLEGMFVSKDYFRVVGLDPAARSHVLRRRSQFPAGTSHHHRLRPLAAEVRRRSQHHRHEAPYEPPRHASNHHRRDATRRSLPAVTRNGAGAQLQRQRTGRFLDADGGKS